LTIRVLGVLSQLALLVFAVAMRYDWLAVLVGAFFIWQGSALVYGLLSGREVPSATVWLTSRLQGVGVSDGAWAVAAGIGVVVIICGVLLAVASAGRPGHFVGAAIVAPTAWALGTMRRARQRAQSEQ
jgi:hypothetical protein